MDFWIPPKPAIIRPAPADLRQDWRREPKKASFLPGWFPAGAVAGGGPDLSLLSASVNAANQAAYTFSTLSFGAAAADRLLIVAIAGNTSGSVATLLSTTIGGVSATIHAQANNQGNTRNGHAAVVSALVTAGTSGDVVITWDTAGAMLDCGYALYRVTGLVSATPTDTATDSGASPSLLIDRANLGFIIASASAVSASTLTWPSPMVEDFEQSNDGTMAGFAHTPVTAGAVTNFAAGPSGDAQSPSRYAAASWA
jgi:hypothetical protein